jgi:hypothetical protein
MTHKIIKVDNYLLVVDDSEIKVGDYFYSIRGIVEQAVIDYPKNEHYGVIIAHLPLNGSSILQGVDLLPPIEDGIEEAEKAFTEVLDSETKQVYDKMQLDATEHGFIVGYNRARDKYGLTLSKLIDLYVNETGYGMDMWSNEENETMSTIAKIIQSFHQYPSEFECEMESVRQPPPSRGFSVVPITVISAQGVEWVGKYK